MSSFFAAGDEEEPTLPVVKGGAAKPFSRSKPLGKAVPLGSRKAKPVAAAVVAPPPTCPPPAPPVPVPLPQPAPVSNEFSDLFADTAAAPDLAQRRALERDRAQGSKFDAAAKAARDARELDRERVLSERAALDRDAEAGDTELAAVDKEMGTFVTAGYKARLEARKARSATAVTDEDDAVVSRHAPGATLFKSRRTMAGGQALTAGAPEAPAAAPATVGGDYYDDLAAAALPDLTRRPVAGKRVASAAAAEAMVAADTAEVVEPLAPAPPAPDAAPAVVTGGGTVDAETPAEATQPQPSATQQYEAALAALEAGQAQRRRARARQGLSAETLAALRTRYELCREFRDLALRGE